jgi:hypothetical protein
MRTQREYEATVHLFDVILYISAFPRVSELDPTMEIKFDPSYMHLVNNAFSWQYTEIELDDIKNKLGSKRSIPEGNLI